MHCVSAETPTTAKIEIASLCCRAQDLTPSYFSLVVFLPKQIWNYHGCFLQLPFRAKERASSVYPLLTDNLTITIQHNQFLVDCHMKLI